MNKNILLNIPPVEAGIRTSETKICTFSGVAAQWFYKSLHPV
jgi:(p)ppGpp synthase/HD superfamily hydrolase